MKEYDVLVAGLLQQFHGDLEGRKHFYSFRYGVLFAHGSPYVRIYDVRAGKARIIGRNDDLSACLRCCLCDFFHNSRVKLLFEFIRSECHEFHSHLGASVHPGVTHVVPDVSAEDYFYIFQRFVYVFLYGHHVGQDLCRVVLIGEPVPDYGA